MNSANGVLSSFSFLKPSEVDIKASDTNSSARKHSSQAGHEFAEVLSGVAHGETAKNNMSGSIQQAQDSASQKMRSSFLDLNNSQAILSEIDKDTNFVSHDPGDFYSQSEGFSLPAGLQKKEPFPAKENNSASPEDPNFSSAQIDTEGQLLGGLSVKTQHNASDRKSADTSQKNKLDSTSLLRDQEPVNGSEYYKDPSLGPDGSAEFEVKNIKKSNVELQTSVPAGSEYNSNSNILVANFLQSGMLLDNVSISTPAPLNPMQQELQVRGGTSGIESLLSPSLSPFEGAGQLNDASTEMQARTHMANRVDLQFSVSTLPPGAVASSVASPGKLQAQPYPALFKIPDKETNTNFKGIGTIDSANSGRDVSMFESNGIVSNPDTISKETHFVPNSAQPAVHQIADKIVDGLNKNDFSLIPPDLLTERGRLNTDDSNGSDFEDTKFVSSSLPGSGITDTVHERQQASKLTVLSFRLIPDGLGDVNIKLRLSGSNLNLEMKLSSPQTVRMIAQDKEILADKLNSSGYMLDKLDVKLQDTSFNSSFTDAQANNDPHDSGNLFAGGQGSNSGPFNSDGQSSGAGERQRSNTKFQHLDADAPPPSSSYRTDGFYL